MNANVDPACPDAATIDALLDGELAPGPAAQLRAHVAGCARCLDAHGALFEVVALAPRLRPPVPTPAPAPLPFHRWCERVAVAAVLLLAGLLVQHVTPAERAVAPPSASPPPILFELTLRETSLTADGVRTEIVRTFVAGRDSGSPPLLRVESSRRERAGPAVVHRQFVPLVAALPE